MRNHTKVYFDYFGYDESDIIICEICQKAVAVDIHHIEARGIGGSRNKDVIENLMAVCRACHCSYGDIKEWKDGLKKIHGLVMLNKN